jgi:hypothetical protein
MEEQNKEKIIIVGLTGVGKSHTANNLSKEGEPVF